MRRFWWAVIVVLVALDTGAGSYLWWLLDHKRPDDAARGATLHEACNRLRLVRRACGNHVHDPLAAVDPDFRSQAIESVRDCFERATDVPASR